MVYFLPFTVDYLHKHKAECLPSSVEPDHENSTRERSERHFPKHLYMAVHGIVLAKI